MYKLFHPYILAEIEKQFTNSNTKAIICTVGTYSSVQEAVTRTGKPIKLICVKTDAAQSLPENAINFFELIKTDSKNWINKICAVDNIYE